MTKPVMERVNELETAMRNAVRRGDGAVTLERNEETGVYEVSKNPTTPNNPANTIVPYATEPYGGEETFGEETPCVEVAGERVPVYGIGNGIVECRDFAGAHVLLLGCGSVGGEIAMQLGVAGVGAFTLVDPDRVQASNLSRLRDAGIADVGRLKVEMFADRLKGKNPCCTVATVAEDLTRDPDRLDAALNEVNLVVCSTDNRASRIVLAEALERTGKFRALCLQEER